MKCDCGSSEFAEIGFTNGEDKDIVIIGRRRIAGVSLKACLGCGRVYLSENDLANLRADAEDDKIIKEIQEKNKAKKKAI